jgi:hypothetical protein
MMLFKVQLAKKVFWGNISKSLVFLLIIQLISLAQEKSVDERIYKSLPAQVVLSEKDITETIQRFRRDNFKKAVERFVEKMPPVVSDVRFRQQVQEKLPGSIKKSRVDDQKIIDLTRKIILPVLTLYNREQVYEIWLVKHPMPFIFSDSGIFLVISTGLIERTVNNDELLGYTAHEIGHEHYYQTSIYTKQVLGLVIKNNEDQALARKYWESLAIIELKCDGFSALTLAQLGYNPLAVMEGLERIEIEFSQYLVGFHPRAIIRKKVVESILPSESLSIKTTLSADLKKLKEQIASISENNP